MKLRERDPYIAREAVRGRLGRVHDEVPQREAEALGGPPQAHRFRSRPRERLLFCGGVRGGGISHDSPVWGFILHVEKRGQRELKSDGLGFFFVL